MNNCNICTAMEYIKIGLSLEGTTLEEYREEIEMVLKCLDGLLEEAGHYG
jgi:hypothetical protein